MEGCRYEGRAAGGAEREARPCRRWRRACALPLSRHRRAQQLPGILALSDDSHVERSDLTGFAALLGESLTARVGLLERLLGQAHYPSLGQYKERLLADSIKSFLPSSVEVGNGFVLFPHSDQDPPVPPELYDPLNQSAYSISKQCDIIVYDSANFPPIFRDGDFVVLRPEAVRAIIEVKGSLSRSALQDALESFHDFALKWRSTQLFYLDHHQATTSRPGVYLMAWDFQRDKLGRPTTNPPYIRSKIANFYSELLSPYDLDGYPLLGQLFVHNECAITAMVDVTDDSGNRPRFNYGWIVQDGWFVRPLPDGNFFRDRDRTVAALLAALHWDVDKENFNRFFSYTDEIHGREVLPYRYSGTSWAWTDIQEDEGRHINAEVPMSGRNRD